MKYRFGMPWYGWLLLFIFLVFVPTLKTQLFPPSKPNIVARKE
jgi:hypothetical protein